MDLLGEVEAAGTAVGACLAPMAPESSRKIRST